MSRIGTLREKPLHASLKKWYAQPGDRIEHPVSGYVIDLVRDDLLIEIQTRGFAGMKAKLHDLIDSGHRLRVVYPVAAVKWISKVDGVGTVVDRRKSPKHETTVDVVAELVSFPHLLAHPSFELDVVHVDIEEVCRHEPGRSWRRNGWVVQERRLLQVRGRTRIASPFDLLPPRLPLRFTTSDLASVKECSLRTGQQLAYCLRHAGALRPVGKDGNSVIYEVRRPD